MNCQRLLEIRVRFGEIALLKAAQAQNTVPSAASVALRGLFSASRRKAPQSLAPTVSSPRVIVTGPKPVVGAEALVGIVDVRGEFLCTREGGFGFCQQRSLARG